MKTRREKSELVYEFSDEEWALVIAYNAQADILDAAEKDAAAVAAVLDRLKKLEKV
jgi:hypothetical protein